MGEPDLFQLLFFYICCWIIREVVTTAFELVGCRKLSLLFTIRIERFEGRLVGSTLRLCKRSRGV